MQTTGLSTIPIIDRSDDNRRRKDRLKQMKRGPGVFVYEGGHKSVDFIPTIKTRDKFEPVVDEDGAIVTDELGRPTFKAIGKEIVKDHRGMPMLGGKPKRIVHEHETFSMPGWALEGEEPLVFEVGVPQRVKDPVFALKLRCHGACRELEGAELDAFFAAEAAETEAPKAKRGRKPKTDAADGADAS